MFLQVRLVARDMAFPADAFSTASYIWDVRGLLIKQFPEFRCYRDIAFYYHFFLNPSIGAFPPKQGWTQRQAELHFAHDPGHGIFFVQGYPMPGSPQLRELSARPPPPRPGETSPTHRFRAFSDPSVWTKPQLVESENDVLHM